MKPRRYVIEIRTSNLPDTWGFANECLTRADAEDAAQCWRNWKPDGFDVLDVRVRDRRADRPLPPAAGE
jgi:hypothetical protein